MQETNKQHHGSLNLTHLPSGLQKIVHNSQEMLPLEPPPPSTT